MLADPHAVTYCSRYIDGDIRWHAGLHEDTCRNVRSHDLVHDPIAWLRRLPLASEVMPCVVAIDNASAASSCVAIHAT
ncbi:MAG: hypothetical protein QG550_2734 [Pseudomonadota bacterium]|jgi:hypothetical protein|nr:hypothetical protein [Pseudomonadota bacterium]